MRQKAIDRDSWRQAYTVKEDGSYRLDPRKAANANASAASGVNAYSKLLRAMRSKAPGTWTDDRWEQSKHFTTTPYVAIHRICVLLSQSEYDVLESVNGSMDPNDLKPAKSKEGERLIRYLGKPNWKDSWGKWMYRVGQQKWLTGSALDWMVPNMIGEPVEHYVVPTALAVPQTVMKDRKSVV